MRRAVFGDRGSRERVESGGYNVQMRNYFAFECLSDVDETESPRRAWGRAGRRGAGHRGRARRQAGGICAAQRAWIAHQARSCWWRSARSSPDPARLVHMTRAIMIAG